MSAPAPLMVNVPPENVASPAMPTAPTSPSDHDVGSPPTDAATLTCVNIDWFRMVGSWLVTASPATALPASVAVPSVIHVAPSVDTAAVTAEPARVSFNHAGDVTVAPAIKDVLPPVDARVMNSIPPSGLTSRTTCAEASSADWRIMTPAFANGDVICSPFTTAMIVPSPASGCDTNWNASAVPQMSAPAPAT